MKDKKAASEKMKQRNGKMKNWETKKCRNRIRLKGKIGHRKGGKRIRRKEAMRGKDGKIKKKKMTERGKERRSSRDG